MLDRLHDHQSIGPPIDPRGDYPAHLWLVEQYRLGADGLDGLRDRMDMVAEEFVANLTDTTEWPREARVSLLDMVQECRMDLNAVETLIRGGALLEIQDAGRDAHASLLKSSLAVGHRRSPDFWLEQLGLLENDYGALIFGGLLEHGIETAAEYLPRCCASEDAIAHMDLLIPALVDKYGLDIVGSAVERQLDSLLPDARTQLSQSLEDEGYEFNPKPSLNEYGAVLMAAGESVASAAHKKWSGYRPSEISGLLIVEPQAA
jgi:hypothetical protein